MYAVTWKDPVEGTTHRLRCQRVEDSSLGLGFVCLADFVFGKTGPLVDPTQEALATRFADVKRLHLNVYTIVAIEELGDELSFDNDRSKLLLLPTPGDSE